MKNEENEIIEDFSRYLEEDEYCETDIYPTLLKESSLEGYKYGTVYFTNMRRKRGMTIDDAINIIEKLGDE